jgi:hypothetical protein
MGTPEGPDPGEAPAGQGKGKGSWINTALQTKVAYRAGDTMISVPPKSGTTWTMNIVHQLRTGGDADFLDIYREVPWVELRSAREGERASERERKLREHALREMQRA